jgi:polar amino acid transport system substrate-binding protein
VKNKKKNLCFAAALLAAALFAAASPLAAQTLHVVTESTPNSFLQNGRVTGPATEIVEQTLKRAGLTDFRIDLYPWARAQDLASREPFVLIYLIARTPERENRYRWVGEVKRSRYHLFGLADRADLRLTQLDDARAWTIGVVRDDVRQLALQRRGFTRLAVSAQPAENFRKLLNRQVDMVVLSEGEARTLCAETKPACTGLTRLLLLEDVAAELYMAFSITTPEDMAARARTAFESLRADGTLQRTMGVDTPPAPAPRR